MTSPFHGGSRPVRASTASSFATMSDHPARSPGLRDRRGRNDIRSRDARAIDAVAVVTDVKAAVFLIRAMLVAALAGCTTHGREQAGHFEIRSVHEDFAGH